MVAFPIATTKAGGICFAFPDICNTPAGPTTVPIPYPNIGQLSDAQAVSDNGGKGEVKVGGEYVILKDSSIPTTTGDEAGSAHSTIAGEVTFTKGSSTVKIYGQEVIRMLDPTQQNAGNAVGNVLGGEPQVLVGG